MNDAIISVENLGKCYRLSHQGEKQRYTALRDVVAQKFAAPFKLLSKATGGKSTDRKVSPVVSSPSSTSPSSEDFWALRDVSFEVKPGEVVGIIGRNGAGKSTLLKILSRITEPSTGRVQLKGRVASLLEVGTGFHPELTGRENIFLNGAILGMSRVEIKRKFDEIVAFAEVEKFLDTPVKRYSSGMYVRLAFAVAAHLEPEILIVDEVLAVGDAQFQKKCLGKMKEVSRGGRTVLFVSHNMAAVKSLTTRGVVLKSGSLVFDGASDVAVQFYTNLSSSPAGISSPLTWGRGRHTAICQVKLLDQNGKATLHYVPGSPFRLEIELETDGRAGLSLDGFLLDQNRARIAYLSDYQFHGETLKPQAGRFMYQLELQPLWLASGNYSFDITTAVVNSNWDHYVEAAVDFEVIACNPLERPWDLKQSNGFGHLALISLTPSRCKSS